MIGYKDALEYAMSYRNVFKQRLSEEDAQRRIKKGGLKYHHTSLVKGYTTRKHSVYAEYDGRFGKGIAVFQTHTSRLSWVTYYV